MKKLILSFSLLALLGCAKTTQTTIERPNYQSAECNADGTVTFRYHNGAAKDVKVDVQFAGRHDMVLDSVTGIWSVTLGPAAPDMYPYCFIVDGISIADPLNEAYFPNEGFKNSLLSIAAPDSALLHDITNVKHGTVEYVNYFSSTINAVNHAVVYLPPTYAENTDKRYPVFYLISGTTDTEEVYYKVGRTNYIADNLIDQGDAEEMIIVMPYGNPYKLLPSVPDVASVPQTNFGADLFSLDLNNDLMPYIERTYRTINDADHRAIGGFSRGGNQALSNGLRHLDKFAYLCSYSSFTTTDIPDVYNNADDTNARIKLFWLGVGTDDFLYGNARDYTEFLDKKGIRSVKEYTSDKFGHTWMNAKYFLGKTLRLLFRPEAAAEAMANAQPTRPATGNEAQFTPGVMARLFPKPIISPEYTDSNIVFRFKAENAESVMLQTETGNVPMQRDSLGVWSIAVDSNIDKPFTYTFLVNGISVADPNNMYASPLKGFRPISIACHPQCKYSYANAGNIVFGNVAYSFGADTEAVYTSPAEAASNFVEINLVGGQYDTTESWFKNANANVVADLLFAEGKIKPVKLIVGKASAGAITLDATKFGTWAERQAALEALLLEKAGM